MKILILGATGRTGKLILKEVIKKGFEVNCLVREPKKIKENSNLLTVYKGSPENISDLKKAIKGCNGLISSLNISRKSDFPWSKLRTPPNLLSCTMNNVVSILEQNNNFRIVVCSAWGISETRLDIPFWFKTLIDYSNISTAYIDHEKQENILKSSNLDWTIVRPSGLINSKKEKKVNESYGNNPKPKITISRENVAKFMVNALTNKKLIGKTPVIST